MQITDLNTTESKLLMLVHSRIHYDNMDSVSHLLDHIEKNGYFKSQAGLAYKNALFDFRYGTAPSECIYCKGKLASDNYLICNDCNGKLVTKVVKGTKSLSDEEELEDEKAEKSFLQNKLFGIPMFICLCAVVLIVVLTIIGIVVWESKKDKTSIDVTNTSSTQNTSQIQSVEAVSDNSEGNLNTTQFESDKFDGFDFLGNEYKNIESLLGISQNVINENTKYFASCGVSVIINETSGVIEYIDNDGTGDGSIQVPIFGILPGVSAKEAREIFTEKNIEIVDYADNSFMCMFKTTVDTEKTYEIDVTSNEEGKVILVAAHLLYQN